MNKYFIALIVGLITLLFVRYRESKYGTVIILNGPSVSGKSSIQKTFQQLMMPNLWIKVGIDNLFDQSMPDINAENILFWQQKNPIRWIETTQDIEQNQIIALLMGDQGEKVAYGMNSAIAAYAKSGCNVIVDYIAYKKEWIDDLAAKLRGLKIIWVKVQIPLSVLEEREVARGTSPKGHARSHYHAVYWDIKYDLTVDSILENALQIAQKIKNFVKSERDFCAKIDDIKKEAISKSRCHISKKKF